MTVEVGNTVTSEEATLNSEPSMDAEVDEVTTGSDDQTGDSASAGTSLMDAGEAARDEDGDEEEDDEDGEVYEVETVLQERTRKGVKEYLVRWKSYGPEYDTWEPEDNLNCDEIIEAFKQSKKKGTPGRKRKTPEETPKKDTPAKRGRGRPPSSGSTPKKPKAEAKRGRAGRPRKESRSEAEEEDNNSEPATIVRCKTRFKKFLIEHAIKVEDDRDLDDDNSEDPLKKYFFKYDIPADEFSVGSVKVEINEESKVLTCSSCHKPGPPWGRTSKESTPTWARHLSNSMKWHVIGQHLGGFSCRICDKNQLVFHSRTLRQFQMHMNEMHRRRLDVEPYQEDEDEGEGETTEGTTGGTLPVEEQQQAFVASQEETGQ